MVLECYSGEVTRVYTGRLEGLRVPATAQNPRRKQHDARPWAAGNLLRNLGFGDLGLDLLQQECSLS